MLLATILGNTTATIKHASMARGKLLVARELDLKNKPVGDPMVVLDQIGAGVGQTVLITSDGNAVRDRLKDKTSPVRWMVVGLVDDATTTQGVAA